ncbi:MAG: putative metal-binding motif-containing protein [Deltaproteobacteria bacterium]|nr:putative metal-binding motif-containing protein [Deltaproteobacteria bacterium]
MRGVRVITALLVGCGRIHFDAADDGSCEAPITWYADIDGDGHGDPAVESVACTQPADGIESGDDCDDSDRYRFPGAPELCDGLDNDCSAGTQDVCPVGCTPIQTGTAPTYLVCTT